MLKPKVIAFYRVSTEDQAKEDRAGLPRQRTAVARVVAVNNLEIVAEIELIDVSGADVHRAPQYIEMVRKVKDREIDGVVAADLDRLCRPQDLSQLSILDTFKQAGAKIYTEGATFDQTTLEGILQSRLLAILAGHERSVLKKRSRDAKEAKRRQGKCPSSKITLPLGVDYDRKNNVWIYTPQVEQVKEAFRLIDEEGITNLTALSKKVAIQPRTLWNQLRNPIYFGFRVYDKKRGDEKYLSKDGKQADRKKIFRSEEEAIKTQVFTEPAVDPERFERVQKVLEAKGAKWRRQRECKAINLGSGLALCGQCGRKLYACSGRRKGKKRQSYYCCAANYYLNKKNGESCDQPNIRQDHLDKTLVAFVADYLTQTEVIESLTQKLTRPVQEVRPTGLNRMQQIENKKARLLDAYADGLIEKDELAKRIKTTESEIQVIKNISKAATERAQVEQEIHRSLRLLAKAAVAFKQITTPAEKKQALRGLFASVVFKGPEIAGFIPIHQFPAGYTENGSHTDTDSSQRRA